MNQRARFALIWAACSAPALTLTTLAAIVIVGGAFSGKALLASMAFGLIGTVIVVSLSAFINRTFLRVAMIDRGSAAQLGKSLSRSESGDLSQPWEDLTIILEGEPLVIRLSEVYSRLVGVLVESDRMSSHLNLLAHEIMEQAGKLSQGAEDQSKSVVDSTEAVNAIDAAIRQVVGAVDELAELGENVSAAAFEMMASIEEVSGNAQSLARAADETASATQEMVSNIHLVSDSTRSLT